MNKEKLEEIKESLRGVYVSPGVSPVDVAIMIIEAILEEEK